MTEDLGAYAAFEAAARSVPVDLGKACMALAMAFDEALLPHGAPERRLTQLDGLAAQVPPDGDPVRRLRVALGGFATLPADYADLRASLLHEVLRRRHGLPILLSVLWVEVGRRAGIGVWGVGLPGHFVVGLGDPAGRYELRDPATGGAPWRLREGDAEHVRAWEPVEVLGRVLANIRGWAAQRPERIRLRLTAVDLALLLPRHPLALRRERGRLLVSSGSFLDGAEDLVTYADVVEAVDPGAAEGARREARQARALLN